ncbi:MAG: dihydroorotase [Deltaproteobacteria bacterium]|nr:MAG: dihydroorotase [Deltaproteobacteria bacterium]
MGETFDLLLRGGTVMTPGGRAQIDVGVRGDRIAALGDLSQAAADEILDVSGLHVLPGCIDTQVHFREPGFEHKEDLETGTRAAVLGGITGVFDMPNTRPTTTTRAAFEDKLARAEGRVHCDIAFYVGATPDNVDALADLERLPGCAGVKCFMGKSTGDLLIPDDATLEAVLRAGHRRMAVHAEDEARLRARYDALGDDAWVGMHPVVRDELTTLLATRRLLRLARKVGRRVHVLHVTTADEMELLAHHKDLATVETCPQHLTLVAPECYDELGTLAQMNPPIRGEHHRAALWRAVATGVVDVLGSDHAPHTLDEKARAYPESPSGMPGVQTILPLMLDHVHEGRLTLERVVDLLSAGPARIFGIARKGRIAVGYDADFSIVDLGAVRTIDNAWIASRCGWTPFAGRTVHGFPRMTVVRGTVVMRDDEIVAPPSGRPMRFWETLAPDEGEDGVA